jgi:hypothetical protein
VIPVRGLSVTPFHPYSGVVVFPSYAGCPGYGLSRIYRRRRWVNRGKKP